MMLEKQKRNRDQSFILQIFVMWTVKKTPLDSLQVVVFLQRITNQTKCLEFKEKKFDTAGSQMGGDPDRRKAAHSLDIG